MPIWFSTASRSAPADAEMPTTEIIEPMPIAIPRLDSRIRVRRTSRSAPSGAESGRAGRRTYASRHPHAPVVADEPVLHLDAARQLTGQLEVVRHKLQQDGSPVHTGRTAPRRARRRRRCRGCRWARRRAGARVRRRKRGRRRRVAARRRRAGRGRCPRRWAEAEPVEGSSPPVRVACSVARRAYTRPSATASSTAGTSGWEVELLEHEADRPCPQPRQLAVVQLGDVLAVDPYADPRPAGPAFPSGAASSTSRNRTARRSRPASPGSTDSVTPRRAATAAPYVR